MVWISMSQSNPSWRQTQPISVECIWRTIWSDDGINYQVATIKPEDCALFGFWCWKSKSLVFEMATGYLYRSVLCSNSVNSSKFGLESVWFCDLEGWWLRDSWYSSVSPPFLPPSNLVFTDKFSLDLYLYSLIECILALSSLRKFLAQELYVIFAIMVFASVWCICQARARNRHALLNYYQNVWPPISC